MNFTKQLDEYKLKNCIYQEFYIDIVTNLNQYLNLLSQLEYLKFKNRLNFIFKDINSKNIEELFDDNIKFKQLWNLEDFVFLIIKMLLGYLGSFEGTYKNKLFIETNLQMQILKYKFCDTISIQINNFKEEIKGDNSYTSIFDIQHKNNKKFYDKFYLYVNLLPIYFNKLKYINKTLDFEDYTHIKKYANIFLNNIQIISEIDGFEIDWAPTKDAEVFVQNVIKLKLNNYRQVFLKEENSNLRLMRTDNEYYIELMEQLDVFIKEQLDIGRIK